MADTKKRTHEENAPVPEKPKIRTRWLDGSKFVDPEELGKSEVFRSTVRAVRKIDTSHTSQ